MQWTMKCEDGVWQGNMLDCTPVDFGTKPCGWKKEDPNLVTFYNDQEITEEKVDFPPGSLLVSLLNLVYKSLAYYSCIIIDLIRHNIHSYIEI